MLDRFSKFTVLFVVAFAVSSESVKASSIAGRLINGINADNNHAFAVRIHSAPNQTSPTAYLSTGVAITETVVVTVAQAIENYTIWFVFSGGVISAEQTHQQSNTGVRHPNYNSVNFNNNIGVIVLATPLINYIPVASPGATIGSYQVFGYGINADNQLPSALQTAPFTSITHAQCVNIYGSDLITENNFCAVSATNGQAADGDQGGPLIPLFLGLQVSGIVSFWGVDATLPVVFERVNAYDDFLENFL